MLGRSRVLILWMESRVLKANIFLSDFLTCTVWESSTLSSRSLPSLFSPLFLFLSLFSLAVVFWEHGLWSTGAFYVRGSCLTLHIGMCRDKKRKDPSFRCSKQARGLQPVMYMSALCWHGGDPLPVPLVPSLAVLPFPRSLSCPFCIPTKTPQCFQDQCFIFSSSSVTTVAAQQTHMCTPARANTLLLPVLRGHKAKTIWTTGT